jgi:GT2 family glycosyltransferase
MTPDPAAEQAPEVSIVILDHNEGDRLRSTVDAMLATIPAGTEIVVVDDGSTDGSADGLDDRIQVLHPAERLGVARGRNYGAAHCAGRIIVFSDGHVRTEPGWLEPLVRELDQECWSTDPVGAVAPAVGHLDGRPGIGHGYTWQDLSLGMKWLQSPDGEPLEVPFLCGCFVGMRREVFDAIGGFDEGMYRWGSEDSELCLRLWLAGYRCLAVPDSLVFHLFRDRFPYDVDDAGIVFNVLRLAALHFTDEGLARFCRTQAHRPGYVEAWPQLLDSDTWKRRERFDAARVRDAQWFSTRFALDAVG